MESVIETDRLILRAMRFSDASTIAEKINNYEISKNLARVPFPYTHADAEDFLEWAATLDDRSAFRVIELKQKPENMIGIISYDWIENKQCAELGYWMIPEHWGKGLMTEAAVAMVELAFTHSGLENLSSCFFNENPASGKVLAHAGFEVTGPCTHFSKARGHDVPVTTVALSKLQWLNKKAAI